MKNTMKNKQVLMNYVEVKDEPDHKEVYKNQQIRIYIAAIRPGHRTLYHRHTEDTVYIVMQGGVIGTQSAGDSRRYPIDFPKSFSFFTKVRWGIRNLLIGSVKMPKGFFFCMMHQKQPVIHRASASKDNLEDMIMMGIEIKKNLNHKDPLIFDHDYYKNDYESNTFAVYRLKLNPGESTGCHTYNFPALIVALKGIGCLNTKDFYSSALKKINMICGEFQWYNCKTALNISNIGDGRFEAVMIALK